MHFLVNLGARGAHVLRFLGIPAERVVALQANTLYCAKHTLFSDTEMPAKYGRRAFVERPRPPELFLNTARAIQQVSVVWNHALSLS